MMKKLMYLDVKTRHYIYHLSNLQDYVLYKKIVVNSANKSSENNENHQKQDFQEKGRIDVKPFLDPSDGGDLTPKKPEQIPFLVVIIVSIIVLWVIANSLSPLFRQRTPNEENDSKTLEEDRPIQPTSSEEQHSITVPSETVTYTDNYAASQEEQPIISDNLQDMTPNQAEQESLTVKQIFDSNKIDNQEANNYE
ncbi:hypothetical protein IQ270_13275 [Microcoleus sp. LEGE 07076]|uniref:hypothetical protein n=1 Tax=Microcoleus sp. LEGE 07076 TaxID=915322 RepID=UPI001882102D|nr:hypothetical protein [Microcoleus sp. LEGE 07076]MBE9185640.1 hypothetical protein [Microcoleus sp. LEGE 07076]